MKLNYFIKLTTALLDMENEGYVHSDLKPENVIINTTNEGF